MRVWGGGKGRGGSHVATRDPARVADVEPLVAPVKERMRDYAEMVESPQIPQGVLATPVIQDILVRMVRLFESMALDEVFPTAPTSFQVGGREKTLATRTLEHVDPCFQTPGVVLVVARRLVVDV